MITTKLNAEELNRVYEQETSRMICQCVFANELVGGVPASREGIEQFVTHHLKIEDHEEAQAAVNRIMSEEVGERDLTPESGELKERLSYAVNVVRRTTLGPYLGDWMIKACFKQAASRLGIFVEKRGTKGNVSEAGRVRAIGISLLETEHPERIYLLDPTGIGPARTVFNRFHGSVTTPQGRASIQHDSECVVAGSRFAFEYRFLAGKLTAKDLSKIVGMMMNVGLGSVKSLERGKFRVEECTVELPDAK